MTAPGHSGAVREIVIPGDPPLAAILGVPDAEGAVVLVGQHRFPFADYSWEIPEARGSEGP